MKSFTTATFLFVFLFADTAVPADVKEAVRADWAAQYRKLTEELEGKDALAVRRGESPQVLDPQSLLRASDRDALDVIIRRTEALLADLQTEKKSGDLAGLKKQLADIKKRAAGLVERPDRQSAQSRERLAMEAFALRRQVVFSNPLLDFNDVLFIARGVNYGTTKDGDHMIGAYYGFVGLKGGSLYVLKDFKSARPRVVNVLRDSRCENGPFQGKTLPLGAYISPEMSFDGKSALFAFSENDDHGRGIYQGGGVWLNSTCFHLFRVGTDGTGLAQLTFGPNNDLDPCHLPGGRIAFISDRRGGMHRCASVGNDLYPEKQFSLHSMKEDGTDLFPISWHETHEFQPSLSNQGMLVYTRWDYVDRCDSTGHHLWTCYPDGRDPRAPHGNYPRPYSTFDGAPGAGNTFRNRVFAEWNIRAVPDSPRYIATAGAHHGQPYGSLVLIDPRVVDDDGLSQVTRITPDVRFPESELAPYDQGRLSYKYGTPWPLSEAYYLANYEENLYLVDKFGNRELLCSLGEVCGRTKPWRLLSPIPVRPRREPPMIPTDTYQGERAEHPDHEQATISVQNVYRSDLPWPKDARIKWLRIIQVLRKPDSVLLFRDQPPVGFGEEQLARMCLGHVPVEEDGSAYFQAPVGVPIYFQAVDQRGMAVQSMRSDTYVHPGEHLSCAGCHENKWETPRPRSSRPLALQRLPSKIEPEVGGVEPVSYHRLVEPIFRQKCMVCHQKEGKGPANLDYGNALDKGNPLRTLVFFQQGGFADTWPSGRDGGAGGSRSIPGMFGAARSKMGQALLKPHHRNVMTDEEFRRVALWLDCQSPELGAYTGVEAQKRGQLVWPPDVNPRNPTAAELTGPSAREHRKSETAFHVDGRTEGHD
jgi:hypothetical protein